MGSGNRGIFGLVIETEDAHFGFEIWRIHG
jgi:hypothetical protein